MKIKITTNIKPKRKIMKKGLLFVFASIIVLPLFYGSYASTYAHIDKSYNVGRNNTDKHTHKSDSVFVGYNNHTGAIVISTAAERKGIEVQIYKEGGLIYEDKDEVLKSSSLSYTLTDEESGAYDVFVTVEGENVIEGTVIK